MRLQFQQVLTPPPFSIITGKKLRVKGDELGGDDTFTYVCEILLNLENITMCHKKGKTITNLKELVQSDCISCPVI